MTGRGSWHKYWIMKGAHFLQPSCMQWRQAKSGAENVKVRQRKNWGLPDNHTCPLLLVFLWLRGRWIPRFRELTLNQLINYISIGNIEWTTTSSALHQTWKECPHLWRCSVLGQLLSTWNACPRRSSSIYPVPIESFLSQTLSFRSSLTFGPDMYLGKERVQFWWWKKKWSSAKYCCY